MADINSCFVVVTEEEILEMVTFLECLVLSLCLFMQIIIVIITHFKSNVHYMGLTLHGLLYPWHLNL